jgi:hypothetical protein
MKSFVWAMAACALAAPANAAPPSVRALQAGYQAGFRDCAAAAEPFVKFVHEDDAAYGFMGVWSKSRPNAEMLGVVTSEAYGDGQGLSTISAVKTASGACNVTVTQAVLIPSRSCADLKGSTFKDWKLLNELNGAPIYQDPTTSDISVVLTPVGKTGCLIFKHLMAFGLAPEG